jgi:hypothetical protein
LFSHDIARANSRKSARICALREANVRGRSSVGAKRSTLRWSSPSLRAELPELRRKTEDTEENSGAIRAAASGASKAVDSPMNSWRTPANPQGFALCASEVREGFPEDA